MKKYLVLTSMLALAACGGGSGGHHGGAIGGVPDTNTPEPVVRVNGTVSDDVINSNQEVTGMLSEIGVASDGSTVDVGSVSRAATQRGHFTHKGKEYTSYKLNDVDFLFADEGFEENGLRFDIDPKSGEITKFIVAGDPDDEDGDKVFERVGKTSKFKGKVRIDSGDRPLVDAILTYTSRGKDLGLKYSDFGTFDIDAVEGWNPVFVGGYTNVKEIVVAEDKITDGTKFTGRAVGHVMASHDGEEQALALDKDATLTFNNGTGTLEAKFDNWYHVNYDTKSNDVSFSNGKNVADEFRLLSDKDGSAKIQATEHQFYYFGNGGVASEAVGAIQVRDCGGTQCEGDRPDDQESWTDEVRMNIGFGGLVK